MKKLKVAFIVDHMGSSRGTPEEEIELHKKTLRPFLGPFTSYQAHNPGYTNSGLKIGTDVIVYDYGGMLYGCDDLLRSNARELLRWAEENPNNLVIVISTFTWEQQIAYEMEDMGLQDLPNIICWDYLNPGLPQWFMNSRGLRHPEDVNENPEGLPNMIFFEPTKKFINWIVNRVSDHMVVDAGAGIGHFSHILREFGVRVIPIDIMPREKPEIEVFPFDATTFTYPKHSVLVIARPCHSLWIEDTIFRAIGCGVKEIIYIGKEINVEYDLGEYYITRFKKVGFGAGSDNESVYILENT